ncbi:MAG: sugar phosphate isomerase/epimerase [Fimbriimonadaceae bacterium]|nr:sugar phosphate isomerase/epimerase [Fimbriimonadaceae bacterium]
MAKIPVGLQLYSVRGEVQNDLPATLRKTAEVGYVGFEPWGYGGDKVEWMGHSPQAIRQLSDDLGLTCCGIHLQTGALLGDNLKRTVELNQILGNRFLIIAADKPRMGSVATILELAKILESAADAVREAGMFTGYHAHGFDFEQVEGKPAWDHLFGNTRADIIMQMDIGNCANGGGDPIGTLRKFPGRARSVHLKDFGGPEGAVIGEGSADWPTIFNLCENQHPVEWYVVEEGEPNGLGWDATARSLANLKAMGQA